MNLSVAVACSGDRVYFPEIRYHEDRQRLRRLIQPLDGSVAIIIGTQTWAELSNSHRNGCKFFVVGSKYYSSLRLALEEIYRTGPYEKIWIWGGERLWKEAFETEWVTEVDFTYFDIPKTGKTFPQFEERRYRSIQTVNKLVEIPPYFDVRYTVTRYQKKHLPFEAQYRDLVQRVLAGEIKIGRNGATRSIPGATLSVDLQDGFPICTGRHVFWRGILGEMKWFLSGSTDAKDLRREGIHIWDKNSSREFLDSRGLNYPEGQIGPGYGYQFRHAGNDQLMTVINTLRTDPSSRRAVISLWPVSDLDKIALPPCHIIYQFLISEGQLHGMMYQRSWDLSLGWNTSTLALLTHIIAHCLSLPAGTIVHTIGDVHIYESHMDGMKEYLSRCPYPLPRLEITGELNLDHLDTNQFKLVRYVHHPKIGMEMVA